MYIYTNHNPHDGYYLAHYGVLGMKWGVRKQRPLDKASTFKTNRAAQKAEQRRKRKERERLIAYAENKEKPEFQKLVNDYKRAIKEKNKQYNKALSGFTSKLSNDSSFKNKVAKTTGYKPSVINVDDGYKMAELFDDYCYLTNNKQYNQIMSIGREQREELDRIGGDGFGYAMLRIYK